MRRIAEIPTFKMNLLPGLAMALRMSRMSPKFRAWVKEILISLVVFTLVFLAVRGIEGNSNRQPHLPNGSIAPEFKLQELTTQTQQSLKNLRGKTVVLNFWATWCSICTEELPGLAGFARKHAPDVAVVTISSDSPASLVAYARRNRLELPILHDRGDHTNHDYGIEGIPATFLVDKEGKVVQTIVGRIDFKALESSIQELNSK